ncbi:2-octaprenyl-6-methoxyphenyl hydroxylase [Thioalkalivibrio sulfidiphilus]|uniref:Ubiquinone biosynthesis hydroxylase, UbiH/UbiF/VisC/COQ6 n=1 Tax=Thioalkalivibrio sulfidiphilus (strain HL-EbGR7) TaxID=396588 RepID=B8GNE6_THISH|nr:2-octaprenyl-6-methoxyphenyl hydroxylase [Thioalkalivibrio sulfidiphilus]ACL73837.1 ubiquinone biosynthesis hydroxylase, UbiH/UbiF/VisC/COQ6 [Thioalkalivibrio sulfidiphilus HL-EbGr7]
MAEPFDILIAGGGMVGATLALAVARNGYRVGVLEARPPGEPGQPSYDDRTTALAYGSRRILEALGLWQGVADQATPIEHIHVSERGRFGVTRLSAADENVPALGYVVANRAIGAAWLAALKDSSVELITPATVQAYRVHADGVSVQIRGQDDATRELRARLLVAADGTHSMLRQLAGIGVHERDYGQTAVIANLTPGRDHGGVAYERFTDEGPIALLPMSEGRCALVWTRPADQVDVTLALNDADFLAALQDRFGHRLGRLRKVGRRAAYPLKLVRAVRDTAARLVLVGNASHTLHPVAGQGFNLALRDVAVLADLLAGAARDGSDPGAPALLDAYSAWRREDLDTVQTYTDGLVRLFTNPWPPLAHARGAALAALDLCPPLRHRLARQSMGLAGRLPRLARGRAL